LIFDGVNSSVSPNELKCFTVGDFTLFCSAQGVDSQTVIETWTVHMSSGAVVFTKSTNGYGKYNGAKIFTGKIKGSC